MGFIPLGGSTKVHIWLTNMESISDFMASSHLSDFEGSKLIDLFEKYVLLFIDEKFIFLWNSTYPTYAMMCLCLIRISCHFFNMN